jgi:adenylylsulfate kinase
VYVDCPTDDLIKRDSTGKYKKALSGEIPNFVGITEPYEPPSAPEVTVHTNVEPVEAGGLKIFQSLLDLAYMTPEELKIITGTKMKANPRPRRGAKGVKAARARLAVRSARGGKAKASKRKR